jgi:condensin complex subunit 3
MKASKFDPVALLKLMGVIVNEEECEKVVEVILEAARSDESIALVELSDPEIRAFRASVDKSLIELDQSDLTCEAEQLFFSRVACRTALESTSLTGTQKDRLLSKVVPDIPVLCEIFQSHAVELMKAIQIQKEDSDDDVEDEECFFCLQLLHLAKVTGLQEEGSRRHFASVMKQMLCSVETPDDLVEGCVQAMRASHEYENDFLETIFQIISELSTAVESENSSSLDVSCSLRILSILTIVLENASTKISLNPLVQEFAKSIVPAVTNENPLVREAGVSCFGKLGLFTNEETVLAEFKPILFQVASNEVEKLEIRGQAILALSDWAMLFSDILQPCSVVEGETLSFVDLVKEAMNHSRPAMVAIAAEVAAKLLFSGRVCESSLIAQLLVIFFDPNIAEVENEHSEVKEVGSPVRLQQLLSLFFQAYSMRSELGRDAMLASIGGLLELANQRNSKNRKKRTVAMPLVKMIEFVCSIVDTGKQSTIEAGGANPAQSAPNNTVDNDMSIVSSTALLASIQVAEFLVTEASNLTTALVRGLCKFIGSHDIAIEEEDTRHLIHLKEILEELGMVVTDSMCLRSLATLNEKLMDVESDMEEQVKEDAGDNESSLGGSRAGEDVSEDESSQNSSGTETEDEGLMGSMTALSMKEKENAAIPLYSRTVGPDKSIGSRRSATSSGSVSILESLGRTPNGI